jgi:hypothetical protein
MATFYVLPPRECLEHAVADFLERLVPGLPAPPSMYEDLLARLAAANPDTFILHREDLPGTDPAVELVDGFGAEPGDAVAEVGLAAGNRPPAVRRWQIPQAVPVSGSGR